MMKQVISHYRRNTQPPVQPVTAAPIATPSPPVVRDWRAVAFVVMGLGLLIATSAGAWRLGNQPIRTTEAAPVWATVQPVTVHQGRNAWTVYVHPPITDRPPLWFEPLPSQREAYNARCAACHSLGR